MSETPLNLADITVLSTLANGIIPPDERDAGAVMVHAGPTIAERVRHGLNGPLYVEGLRTVRSLAQEKFGRAATDLQPTEIQELLSAVEHASPQFFRQLRADVCSLYMSDPAVWQRIGFPGPSTATGGYPDFDINPNPHLPAL